MEYIGYPPVEKGRGIMIIELFKLILMILFTASFAMHIYILAYFIDSLIIDKLIMFFRSKND